MNDGLRQQSLVARIAPWLPKIRLGGWTALAVGLLVLFGLLAWAVVTAVTSIYGQTQRSVGTARQVAMGSKQAVLEQVKQAPALREQLDARLGDDVPTLMGANKPRREVSGEDLGPLPRYPGLVRTAWQRQDSGASVE